MRKLIVTSDGTREGTHVLDAWTREPIEGVTRVLLDVASGRPPIVTMEIVGVGVEAAIADPRFARPRKRA